MSESLMEQPPKPKLKGLDRLRDQFYRSGLYGFWLQKTNLENLHIPACTPLVGRHIAFVEGDQLHHGRQVFPLSEGIWFTSPLNPDLMKWLHGFSWMPLLNDHILAERLITSWIDHYEKWQPLIWDADTLAMRLQQWGWFLNKSPENFDTELYQKIISSLLRQARHMLDRNFINLKGITRLHGIYGQVYAHCLIKSGDQAKFLKRLEKIAFEIEKQILPDGGHISRSPQNLLDILDILGRLEQLCKINKIDYPLGLRNTRDRIYPMMKTLITPASTLAVFHGANEGNPKQFKQVFNPQMPNCLAQFNGLHSGYQRLEAKKSVVLMDCSISKTEDRAHSTFALEVWDGNDCLITNCGQFDNGPDDWKTALNSIKASSCLIIDEKEPDFDPTDDTNPVEVHRVSDKGSVLVEAQHRGYYKEFSCLHKRAVYLNAHGDDIRFEDRILGTGGNRFDLHLHLHPNVQAKMISDHEGVLMQLPSGICWQLTAAPCQIDIGESLYFAHYGLPQKTDQIILSGPLRGQGTTVKWRLSRIGRL